LTGCNSIIVDDDIELTNEIGEIIISSIENKDAEEIKKYLSKTIKKDEKIDENIEDMFEFIGNEQIKKYEIENTGGESLSDTDDFYDLITGSINIYMKDSEYRLYFSYAKKDEYHEDNEGIYKIHIASVYYREVYGETLDWDKSFMLGKDLYE
jgi:hypothetical protein